MNGQKCETCRFWLKDDREPNYDADELQLGNCRRYPGPGIVTNEEQWCGEYATANPTTVTEAAATLARFVILGDMTAARALVDELKG